MNQVYVTGDKHGNAFEYRQLAEFANTCCDKSDIIIIAGDAGLYYGDMVQGQCKKILKRTPCKYFILRGNHDSRMREIVESNSEPWIEDIVFGNIAYYQKKYPNIIYANDVGGTYSINGKKIFMIAGAFSVDGEYRKLMNFPYEPKEQLTKEEQDFLCDKVSLEKIEYVISHTSPNIFEKYYKDLYMEGLNQNNIDKSMEVFMDKIFKIVEPNLKYWYFGHFHDDRICGKYGVMLYRKIVQLGESL